MHRRVIAPLALIALLSLSILTPAAWADLTNRETPLVRAIRKVRPAVVNIHSQKTVSQPNPAFPNAGPAQSRLSGMGTGVIIDERGYFITNYHVVENVTQIRGTLVDGATYSARVIARDPETDLALLKIDPLSPLPVMPIGTSEDLMHGETVIAIGNAFGYEHTITKGIISELHRNVRLSEKQSYRDLIQTDASINPGNSGGPLINADGDMIGINVAIRAGAQGIGFAIPAEMVKEVLAKMLSIRERNGTWHGMLCEQAQLNDRAPGKVIIRSVESSSPAEKAGIQANDRLLSIDGKNIDFIFQLELALLDKRAGQPATITVSRNGETKNLNLVVAAAPLDWGTPENVVWREMGVRIDDNTSFDVRVVSSQLRGGVRIAEVAPGSVADKAGFIPGDILVGLHHWEILSVDNIVYVLNRHRDDGEQLLRFLLIRDGQIHKGWLNIANP